MSKEKLQVGDLVTKWTTLATFHSQRNRYGVGLVVSISRRLRWAEVYWFKPFGKIEQYFIQDLVKLHEKEPQ